jgi:tetratricopeptide (TPR) repeat protein
MKPTLFIASSSEAIGIAYAVQQNLQRQVEATVWDQGVFELSATAIDSLIEALKQSDFGVFIVSPDDIAKIRGQEINVARDNVIFELGLFVGHLGKFRCFILIPDNHSELHLPTDLLGMTVATYETDRRDKRIRAATGPACEEIRDAIRKAGFITEEKQIAESAPLIVASTEEQAINNLEAVQSSVHDGQETDLDKEFWATAFLAQDYLKALAFLETDLSETQDVDKQWDIRVWIGRVKGYISTSSGVGYFEQLIAERPTDHEAYGALAQMYSRKRLYRESLAVLERGVSMTDNKDPLLGIKAVALRGQGKCEDAESLMLEAIRTNPNFVDHFLSLVDIYAEKEDKESANKILKRGIILHPENEELLSKYLQLWDGFSDKKLALNVSSRLTILSPQSATYKTQLGNAYLSNNLYGLALEAYEQANALAGEKEGWILGNIGNAYSNKGFYPKAIEMLKKGLSLEPDSAYMHDRLSTAFKASDEERKQATRIIKAGFEELLSAFGQEEIIDKELSE